jgi:hypothetical protein
VAVSLMGQTGQSEAIHSPDACANLAGLTKEASGIIDPGVVDPGSNPEYLKGFGGHAGRHR